MSSENCPKETKVFVDNLFIVCRLTLAMPSGSMVQADCRNKGCNMSSSCYDWDIPSLQSIRSSR